MLMSQRYPLYFDGIVAGSPAQRTGYSGLATRAITVALVPPRPRMRVASPGLRFQRAIRRRSSRSCSTNAMLGMARRTA